MSDLYVRSHCKAPCEVCPFRKDADKAAHTKQSISSLLDKPSLGCKQNAVHECAGHMQMRPLDNFYVRVMRRLEPGFKVPVSDKVFSSRKELVAYYPTEVMKSYLNDLKDDGKNRDAIIGNTRMTLFYNTKNYERMKRVMMSECKA